MRHALMTGRLAVAAAAVVAAAAAAQGECALTAITESAPVDGATIWGPLDRASMPLWLYAAVDCVYDTQSVQFTFDGGTISGGLLWTEPFEILFPDLTDLSDGEHPFEIQANSRTPGTAPAEVESAISVRKITSSQDADQNGYPDAPFLQLTKDGDIWLDRRDVAETGQTRFVGIMRWDGDSNNTGPITLVLADAAQPQRQVIVTAPRILMGVGEIGLLAVTAAPDLTTLAGAVQAPVYESEPMNQLALGAYYVNVCVLMSQDGGASFYPLQGARLANNPIAVTMTGLTLDPALDYSLYGHPAAYEADVSGLYLRVDAGAWTGLAGTIVGTDVLEADVSAAGTLAFYEQGAEDPSDSKERDWLLWVGIGGLLTPLIYEILEGGGGSSGPCFIATAAFGTPLAEPVDALRAFRDVWLSGSSGGAAFVDAYYRLSPAAADVVARFPALAAGVRLMLVPVIAAVRVFMAAPGMTCALLAAAGLGLLRRARKRVRG